MFDKLTDYFVAMLAPERPSLEHQWALCVFDDLIDFAPNSVQKYQHHFIQPMMSYIYSTSPGVRQAAAYGIGALAIKFPGQSTQYSEFLNNALPCLFNVINTSDAKEVENLSATENCVSAVSKIFKHVIGIENLDEPTIQTWLSWLPIKEDQEEGPIVYGLLMDLIESENQFVLGENNINLPEIIRIIAEAIINKTVRSTENPELMGRIERFLTPLQSSPELWRAILSQLPDTHQQLLSGQS